MTRTKNPLDNPSRKGAGRGSRAGRGGIRGGRSSSASSSSAAAASSSAASSSSSSLHGKLSRARSVINDSDQ